MKQKHTNAELITELKLAFVWQDEVWEAPETVANQDGGDDDAESPSVNDLIEIVLSRNDDSPDATKQMGSGK